MEQRLLLVVQVVVVAGTKADLPGRRVQLQEAQQWAAAKGFLHFEVGHLTKYMHTVYALLSAAHSHTPFHHTLVIGVNRQRPQLVFSTAACNRLAVSSHADVLGCLACVAWLQVSAATGLGVQQLFNRLFAAVLGTMPGVPGPLLAAVTGAAQAVGA